MRSLALGFGGSKASDLRDDMALPHPTSLTISGNVIEKADR
jgi:hypothetical protein